MKGKRDDVELLNKDQELVFHRGDDARNADKEGDQDGM